MPAGFVKTRLVKRETGVIPVRSRHCDKGVRCLGARRRSLGALLLGRRQWMMSFQSGNLPAVGTGASGSGSRGIGRTKKPERSKGLFAVPSAR